MIRTLMVLSIFFTCFAGNALAYLKDYPPYKFEVGPPDHLQVQALTDGTRSEYKSGDNKISATLKKTKSGTELLVKDNDVVVVSKKTSKLPVPIAVYHADIDGNGLNDFIVFYNYRDWFRSGIKEDRVEIFLKQNEGAYQMIAYDAISAGLEDFVDLNGDGKHEVLITRMEQIKQANYFIYNIYEFDGFRLLNCDAKYMGFSKLIRYFVRPNDSDDPSVSREERIALSDKNNLTIHQKAISDNNSPAVIKLEETVTNEVEEFNKELSQKSDAIKKSEDKERKLTAEIEAKERKIQEDLASEKNGQQMLETKIEELTEKLIIFERNLKDMEEENQDIQANMATREREFQKMIEDNNMKYQEALTTKFQELSERSILNTDAIKALEVKGLELTSQFKGKEVEIQEAITSKDKEHRDVIEDRIEELSDKLIDFEKIIKAIKEEEQVRQSAMEMQVDGFAEELALKDKTIEELKDGVQVLRTEVENDKLEFKSVLAAKEKEHQAFIDTRVEALTERLALLDGAVTTLTEENRDLQSRIEAKEAEMEKRSLAQNYHQGQQVLESKIMELEDKEREFISHWADKETQLQETLTGMNEKLQATLELKIENLSEELAVFNKHLNALEEEGRDMNSRLVAGDNDLREELVKNDMGHKEALDTSLNELSVRLTAFEKNVTDLMEADRHNQTRLETTVEQLKEAETYKETLDHEIKTLAEKLQLNDQAIEASQVKVESIRAELENVRVAFREALGAEEVANREALQAVAMEISDKLSVFEENMKVLGDKELHLESRLEKSEMAFEEVLAVKDREYQELLGSNDIKIADLNEKLALKDEVIKALEEKEKQLEDQFEGKEEELQQVIADRDRKYQEVLETRVQELSDKLTVLDMTIQALKEGNQNLQTRLESKDKEYQDTFVTKEREFHAFLENKIEELTEEWLKSLGSLSDEKSLVNVGTVDMQRIIEESKKGREARMFFEGLISLRSEEELTKTEQKLISQIVKDIEVIVQQYAKEHGIIYIVDGVSGGVVHSNKRLDLTDKIIERYDEKVESAKQEEAVIK